MDRTRRTVGIAGTAAVMAGASAHRGVWVSQGVGKDRGWGGGVTGCSAAARRLRGCVFATAGLLLIPTNAHGHSGTDQPTQPHQPTLLYTHDTPQPSRVPGALLVLLLTSAPQLFCNLTDVRFHTPPNIQSIEMNVTMLLFALGLITWVARIGIEESCYFALSR